MANQRVPWQVQSGAVYDYTVYAPSGTWNDVPGNYIFARLDQNNTWIALYIGETRSFQDRFSSHEKWPCATRLGVTHIHAHGNNNGVAARRTEEADLIGDYNPPCND